MNKISNTRNIRRDGKNNNLNKQDLKLMHEGFFLQVNGHFNVNYTSLETRWRWFLMDLLASGNDKWHSHVSMG